MSMNLNQIEKSVHIITEIKTIDAEIALIEKMANISANGITKSSFELIIEDRSETGQNKNVLDNDGSLINNDDYLESRTFQSPFYAALNQLEKDLRGGMPNRSRNNNPVYKINCDTSDIETLTILGGIISVKKAKKKSLMNQLNELGIKTN